MSQKPLIGFGTSGVRGLVTDLTDEVCFAYTKAFLSFLELKGDLKDGLIAIAGDLRESTDRMMKVVHFAIKDAGLETINCGKIPTPALVLYGITKRIPTIMVTGSHIPSDRNGIKFNKTSGEILKEDERVISQMVEIKKVSLKKYNLPPTNNDARDGYVARYLNFFPPKLLAGKRIGLYGHSAVGREIIEEIFESLSAEVIKIEFGEKFVAIDTEAIGNELRNKAKEWSTKYQLDAIVSTDGDGDRPLLSDEQGNWITEDILDIICAKYLGAENLVVTINNSTLAEKIGMFKKVVRCKIGSPYVIEEMNNLAEGGNKLIVGYEANGGFLIGDGFALEALPTRDALIVLLSVLATAKNSKISDVLANLPKVYTCSDSVKEFPIEEAERLLKNFDIQLFEKVFGKIKEINNLDGQRVTLENDEIVHLRSSHNAPEFRYFTEAATKEMADKLAENARGLIINWKINKI